MLGVLGRAKAVEVGGYSRKSVPPVLLDSGWSAGHGGPGLRVRTDGLVKIGQIGGCL